MDEGNELSSSILFSPSKARIQQAQAKDWAAVDTWLSKKYGSKRPPVFERNDMTLEVLLALANLNEDADEQRVQLERVEKTTLQLFSKRQSSLSQDMLQIILSHFHTDDGASVIAEIVMALHSNTPDATQIGHDIMRLTSAKFDTTHNMLVTETNLATLRRDKDSTLETINALDNNAFHPPAEIVESTNEWARSTKHLKAKIAEYEDRISVLQSKTAANGIEVVQGRIADNVDQLQKLLMCNACLDAWRDMPSDPQSARTDIESKRDHLRDLVEKRDRLFGSFSAA